jgi:hypothetical protein
MKGCLLLVGLWILGTLLIVAGLAAINAAATSPKRAPTTKPPPSKPPHCGESWKT